MVSTGYAFPGKQSSITPTNQARLRNILNGQEFHKQTSLYHEKQKLNIAILGKLTQAKSNYSNDKWRKHSINHKKLSAMISRADKREGHSVKTSPKMPKMKQVNHKTKGEQRRYNSQIRN